MRRHTRLVRSANTRSISVQKVPAFRMTNVATTSATNDARLGNALWSKKADYEDTHNNARSLYADQTGVWLWTNDRYKTWLKTHHKPDVLYLTGGPGSGKTVITYAERNYDRSTLSHS
jgi:hypothetical protein